MDSEEKCELCGALQFRYTCPKCNLRYCSVACYKSTSHLKCSEEFYKSCIQDELSAAGSQSKDDMKRIYEILKRIRSTDAGLETEGFADDLDSDDDNLAEDANEREHDFDEEDEVDIATRLQGVNLNDAEDVWNHLSSYERKEFQKMVECGDIMKLVPNSIPWWIKPKASKIVEINTEEDKKAPATSEPTICNDIPRFMDICKKSPSPCVHYNLWNLLAAYSCIVRFFGGEHLTSASEATAHLVNLCTTLKYGTNFEDTEDAILSVETEALTTGNSATFGDLYVESRAQLKEDTRQIMSTNRFKLIALSDILQLFKLAKKHISTLGKGEQAEFQKLFAMCNASVELDRKKLNQFTKRIVFFLAYVNRECEQS